MRTNACLVDTEIGTIANDWRMATLDEVCEPPQYGFTASAGEKGDVRFLRITDITDSGVNWSRVPFCKCPPELVDKFRLRTGDIVFARIGATTGKSYLVRDPPSSVFASYLIRVRPTEQMDPAFLAQFFQSSAYWRQVDAQKHANLKKGVSGSLLRTLVVPVPPLAEQRNIARVLGLVQRAIEQQNRLLGAIAELKKALLQQLFTRGLRDEPEKETEIGALPQSWQVTTLGDVARFQTGGTPSRTNSDYWVGGDIPWVRTTEINYKVIDQTEERITPLGLQDSAAKIFPKGTLLVAMYGQGVTRGRVGILGVDAATNQACAAITPYDEGQVRSVFIYFFLEFHYEHLRQMGHGANQRNLNMALLKGFPFAFPTPKEQVQICQVLAALDLKLGLHRRKQAALTALFRTLLHELMTARIRVTDLDLSALESLTHDN